MSVQPRSYAPSFGGKVMSNAETFNLLMSLSTYSLKGHFSFLGRILMLEFVRSWLFTHFCCLTVGSLGVDRWNIESQLIRGRIRYAVSDTEQQGHASVEKTLTK